jgi:Uma2 family endonuclease
MPPAFSDAGNRNSNITVQLGVWAEQDRTGEVFGSSAGFTLPNGAIRAPDASWIRLERWNAFDEQKASFAPICPDFVIKLRSLSDTLNALKAKMQKYIENDTLLGVLIDRKNRTVYLYRPDLVYLYHPDRTPETLEQPETVSGAPELTGSTLQMAKIW